MSPENALLIVASSGAAIAAVAKSRKETKEDRMVNGLNVENECVGEDESEGHKFSFVWSISAIL